MIKNNHKSSGKKSATSKVTLKSLAQRLEVIEEALSRQNHPEKNGQHDWWEVVGISKNSKILPLIEAEGKAIREAERVAARKKK